MSNQTRKIKKAAAHLCPCDICRDIGCMKSHPRCDAYYLWEADTKDEKLKKKKEKRRKRYGG